MCTVLNNIWTFYYFSLLGILFDRNYYLPPDSNWSRNMQAQVLHKKPGVEWFELSTIVERGLLVLYPLYAITNTSLINTVAKVDPNLRYTFTLYILYCTSTVLWLVHFLDCFFSIRVLSSNALPGTACTRVHNNNNVHYLFVQHTSYIQLLFCIYSTILFFHVTVHTKVNTHRTYWYTYYYTQKYRAAAFFKLNLTSYILYTS